MNGLSTDDINEYYRIMQSTLPTIDPTTKLSIANALWYNPGFGINPSFLKVNTDNFNAYVKELDLKDINHLQIEDDLFDIYARIESKNSNYIAHIYVKAKDFDISLYEKVIKE